MAIQFHTLSKHSDVLHPAFAKVAAIAHKLRECLDRDEAQLELKSRHVFGASSHAIQEVILKDATALGFHSEKKGLFGGYPVAQLRPDYYMAVEDSGILLEVERGRQSPTTWIFSISGNVISATTRASCSWLFR